MGALGTKHETFDPERSKMLARDLVASVGLTPEQVRAVYARLNGLPAWVIPADVKMEFNDDETRQIVREFASKYPLRNRNQRRVGKHHWNGG
jgi:hypothetical protein